MAITPNQPTGFAADDFMQDFTQKLAPDSSLLPDTVKENPPQENPRVVKPGSPEFEAAFAASKWADSLYPEVPEPKMEKSKDVDFNIPVPGIPLLPKTVFGKRVFGRGFKGLKVPGFKIPVHLSGAGLDAAASSVSEELKDRKVGGGAAQQFLAGALGGYAQSRVSDLAARKKAYEDQKKVYDENFKKREDFRKFAMQELFKNSLVKKGEKQNFAYIDYEKLEPVQKEALAKRYQIPPVNDAGQRMIPVSWLEKPEGVSAQSSLNMLNNLKESFANNAVVKRADNIGAQHSTIMALMRQPQSVIRDVGILTAIARMMDDRTGVREGELKTWMQAQGLITQLEMLPERLQGKAFISAENLGRIRGIVNAMYLGSLVTAAEERGIYVDIGRQYNIPNMDKFLRSYTMPSLEPPPVGGAMSPDEEAALAEARRKLGGK